MKYSHFALATLCALVCTLMVGCKKNNAGVWDDDATAGNYKGNARSLWGHDETTRDADFFNSPDEDFISLKDEDLRPSFVDGAIAQPKFSPGDRGSGLPSIDGFHAPTGAEASVFKTVYFNTDDHIVRGKEYTAIIDKISAYLKAHPNTYVFVSGNCDERGPEAYNLSLGSRRADSVRSLLVQKGVDAEKIHTVSYGKEHPAESGHNPDSWSKNRRCEFKLYQR